MKPDDLSLLHVPGRPAFATGDQILVAVISPDLDANHYRGTLVRIHSGAGGDPSSDRQSDPSNDRHSDPSNDRHSDPSSDRHSDPSNDRAGAHPSH